MTSEAQAAMAYEASRWRLAVMHLVIDEPGAQAGALPLSFASYEVQFAYTGKDAIERATCWTSHVAVLAINMPAPDGFQFAIALRGLPATRDVFIVAHRSMDEADVQTAATQGHFDAYCQKGILKRTTGFSAAAFSAYRCA
jgi:CheY-like chemotaxis protein